MNPSSADAATTTDAKRKLEDTTAAEEPQEDKEYTLPDGTVKFNAPVRKPTTTSSAKRVKKPAGVKNSALLSFEDDV